MGNAEIQVQTAATAANDSLYERLGGSESISDVVAELYERMFIDPYVWYYWKGRSSERRASECQRFTDLVCLLAGGPVSSTGRDTAPNVRGLDIGRVDWGVFVNLAAAALESSNLNEDVRDSLFSLLTRTKATITRADRGPLSTGGFAAFPNELTQREREVLTLLALGKNNPEIADDLFISVNTVTRHITNIFAKTSTRNRVEAAVYAARRHLV